MKKQASAGLAAFALVMVAVSACDQAGTATVSGGDSAGTTNSRVTEIPIEPEATAVEPWPEPAAYSYTFSSACGERAGLGTFRVRVIDGKVVSAKPLGSSLPTRLAYVPSLAELTEIAVKAENKADEVKVRYAEEGYPSYLSIDWIKAAIDDEACYFVRNFVVESR